jgi:hypothetical protein
MKKSTTAESPEYRLLVAPVFNERNQRVMTRVVLETTRIFASFRYKLTVKEERVSRSLTYTVTGISAPKLDLPSAGPARFVRDYDDLSGSWTVTVNGLDGSKGTCTLRIGPKQVKMVKQGPEGSIEVVTDPLQLPSD